MRSFDIVTADESSYKKKFQRNIMHARADGVRKKNNRRKKK